MAQHSLTVVHMLEHHSAQSSTELLALFQGVFCFGGR